MISYYIMNKDHRFAETVYDDRYKKTKKRQEKPPVVEEDEEEVIEEEDFAEGDVEASEEESIDMDRVNELLGMDQEEIDAWSDESSEVKLVEESSKRLALLNYDWSKIHAGDLMITFSSFLQDGGQLKKVTVYPSEFGIQRLAQEELEGPGDIFKPNSDLKPETKKDKVKKEKNEKPEKSNKLNRQAENTQWAVNNEQEESALDLAKLRRYERDRLKYYYAVLDFDSGKTADSVYEACNGFELEKTGIKIGKPTVYFRS